MKNLPIKNKIIKIMLFLYYYYIKRIVIINGRFNNYNIFFLIIGNIKIKIITIRFLASLTLICINQSDLNDTILTNYYQSIIINCS